jgi:hypothetical protein
MNNIKIVSFTNRPYKYTDFYTKETEMMAKFDYQIQLAGKIAYFIRRNTNVADEYMLKGNRYYLDENNIVKYGFLCPTEYSGSFDKLFAETVEKISNQGDEDYFIDHLLTVNKKYRAPSDVHCQMRTEYGLYDITDEEHRDRCIERILEWNVAHFFIHLTSILYDPGYEGHKPIKRFRIIVCGGRHFNDYDRMKDEIDKVIARFNRYAQEIEIVSGHCEGADQLGEKYAEECGYPCKVFPANWEKYGRSAGPIRNSEMIKYASEVNVPVVVAFRSPRTKGTNDTIKKATKKGFKVFEFDYDNGESKQN